MSPSAGYAPATSLPGFGKPLDHYYRVAEHEVDDLDDPEEEIPFKFPTVLDQIGHNIHDRSDPYNRGALLALTTLREFTMLQIMDKITDKINWHVKVFDEAITNKWKEEGKAFKDKKVTARMMDWVVAELRHKATIYEYSNAVPVYTGDVVKSDSALSEAFKLDLQTAVKALEDEVPQTKKDWHPGSDGKVLNLVHPSLWPLIYGRSRILPDKTITLDNCMESCGQGVVVPVPADEDTYIGTNAVTGNAYSKKFQWLPCEIDLSGERPKITSYINNLHPVKHQALYGMIEEVIDTAIPLWGMTLGPMVECNWIERLRIQVEYRGGDMRNPDAPVFSPPEETESFDLWSKFADKGLQIIIKLANIELTPEKPSYEGGSWHIEGQLNEHICATAIYYYSNHNVTGSRLMFRQQSSTVLDESFYHAGDAEDWLFPIFGCHDHESTQLIGGVQTREGRLITFPNILQHQVQPFSLIDKQLPGHRKILALFLVDPHMRVLSTANVPPQRKDWWVEAVEDSHTKLDYLPLEVRDEVYDMVGEGDYPISENEARDLRLELMEERKRFESRTNSSFGSADFGLCEH